MNKERTYKIAVVFFLTILFLNISFAQKRKKNNQIPQERPIYFETHILPADSLFVCNLSYKIPYNNLVFIKDNGYYSSGYSVTFEIFEDKKFVKRVIGNGEVITQNYDKTISENLYHEGFVSFNLYKGNFLIKPSIVLNNTAIEAKIEDIKLLVDSNQVYRPIFVKEVSSLCDSSQFQLVNFQNSVPFSDSKFEMLIATYPNIEKPITVEILQNDKTILAKEISDFILLNNEMAKCKNGIVLSNNSSTTLMKFYKLSFINQKLVEGNIEIKIKIGDQNINFTSPVLWYNKPKSLANIEQAIEYLKIIGFNNSVDDLLGFSDDEEYHALFNFWRKFDDDDSTAFNPVFDEFYSRIDFVVNEFNSLGKKDGVDTDRGITYIVYGKPDSIERTFNDVYDVIEIWEYKSINEKIYFSDKTGTGKFERIK